MVRDGHYTTIAYVLEKDRWYHFNDDHNVRPIVDEPTPENLYTLENVGGPREEKQKEP